MWKPASPAKATRFSFACFEPLNPSIRQSYKPSFLRFPPFSSLPFFFYQNFLPAFLPPFLPLPKLSSFRPSLLSLQKPCSFLPSLLSKKSRESVGKKGKEAPQKNPLQPCTPTLFGFLDIMHARTCVCISLYYEEQILWYSTRLVHHHNKSHKRKQKKVVSLYINVSPRFLKKKGESGLTCDRVSVCEYSCLCQWHCTSWMFLVYWAEHLRCVSWKQFQKLMPTKNDTPQQESKKDKQGCLLVFLLVEGMWRNQCLFKFLFYANGFAAVEGISCTLPGAHPTAMYFGAPLNKRFSWKHVKYNTPPKQEQTKIKAGPLSHPKGHPTSWSDALGKTLLAIHSW